MKILLVVGSATIGGTEKQVLGLANALKTNHQVTVGFLNSDGVLLDEFNNTEVTIFNFKMSSNFKALTQSKRAWKFLRNNQFQIVYAFLPESIVILWPLLILQRSKSQKVAGVRGSIIRRGKFISKIYSILLQKSDLVICNSLSLKNYCIQEHYISSKNVIVIPNGLAIPEVDFGKFNNKKILVISNFHSYKGYDILLKALSLIKSEFHAYLLGSGPEEQKMIELSQFLNIENQIIFRGQIDPSIDLSDSWFAVHPSRSEGFSNAVLEELSYGLPVIAFDVGGNSEAIKTLQNGIIAKDFSEKSLSEAIEFLLMNDDERQRMSINAVASVKQYSWEIIAETYETTFRCLIES
jgi:glycosyltransferase involved in cell wall biosynthesis